MTSTWKRWAVGASLFSMAFSGALSGCDGDDDGGPNPQPTATTQATTQATTSATTSATSQPTATTGATASTTATSQPTASATATTRPTTAATAVGGGGFFSRLYRVNYQTLSGARGTFTFTAGPSGIITPAPVAVPGVGSGQFTGTVSSGGALQGTLSAQGRTALFNATLSNTSGTISGSGTITSSGAPAGTFSVS